MFTFTVKADWNGGRLDRFLDAMLRKDQVSMDDPLFSRSAVARFIKDGKAAINDKMKTKPASIVETGDVVTFVMDVAELKPELEVDTFGNTQIIPAILFEDDRILVLDKPAGLKVHPSRFGETGTLVHWLYTTYPQIIGVGEDPTRPGIVHRLDKETSGVLVVAKTQKSFDELKKLFQTHSIEKRYVAVSYGKPEQSEGIITWPIGRVPGSARRTIVDGKRKTRGMVRPAQTEYRMISSGDGYSFLELHPKTGRTHQIRVHLAAIEMPIISDQLYTNQQFAGLPLPFPKPVFQLLHAAELSFECSDRCYRFQSSLPERFSVWINALDENTVKRYAGNTL